MTLSTRAAHAGPQPAQMPSVESMAERLMAGRLVLTGVRFEEAGEDLIDHSRALLDQAARALARVTGRFLVLVPAERDRRFPPDTVLSRRRATAALRALIAAGANPQQLAGPEHIGTVPVTQLVGASAARIELVRVEDR